MENNIKNHQTYDYFDIEDRKFKLNAYDPIEGNYLLIQILTFVMPLGIGSVLKSKLGKGTESIPTDMMSGKLMSKEDFTNLEKDILKTVEECYPSNQTSPVIRENGTYGITDISMGLIIQLLIASLAFNFKDFFEDVPSLKEFMQMPDSKSANTQM